MKPKDKPAPEAQLTEKQLKLLVRHLPFAVAMFDRNMRYLAASCRWIEDYHLTGSILGQSHYDVFPETPEKWKEAHRRGLSGETIRNDKELFIRHDGTIQWLRWEIRPWGYSGRNGIIVFTEDITDKIRNQEQLEKLVASVQEEKNRLTALLDSMTDEVWFTDIHGNMAMANRSGRETFALAKGAEIAVEELIADVTVLRADGTPRPPEEAPPFKALAGETTSNLEEIVQIPATGEMRYRQVNSAPVIGNGGEILGAVSVVRDITAQKNAVKALRDSEKRMQLALQVSRSFTFEWQPATDQVVRSDSCAGILGLSGDDAVHDTGSGFFDRILSDDRVRFQQILQSLGPDNNRYETEYRVMRGDGQLVVLEEIGQGEFGPDGNLLKLFGVTTEITQRKQMEEALEKLNAQLEDRVNQRTVELARSIEALKQEHNQRMEAINALRERDQMLIQQSRLAAMGEMVNNIGHQWRQPLNVLGLQIQELGLLYSLGQLDAETVHQSIQASMKQIKHMSETIDDFRNFFRPNKEKSLFTLQETVDTTLSLIQDALNDKQITVTVDLQSDGQISGFFNEFCQTLLSIIQNARDVLVERRIITPRVAIASMSEKGRLVITITDNAGGIAPDVIPHVFEPYFSTKGSQGTGIGLYMAKSIIDAMGGSITVHNSADGAAFRIEMTPVE